MKVIHYRKRLLCQVFFYRALSKEAICRVPEIKHSANNWHSRQRGGLPSAEHSANNNTRQRGGLPSAKHSANQNTRQRAAAVNGRQPPLALCRVSSPDTRQNGDLPSVIFDTRQTIFFSLLTSKLFLQSSYNTWYTMFQCGTFLGLFYISLIYFI